MVIAQTPARTEYQPHLQDVGGKGFTVSRDAVSLVLIATEGS